MALVTKKSKAPQRRESISWRDVVIAAGIMLVMLVALVLFLPDSAAKARWLLIGL